MELTFIGVTCELMGMFYKHGRIDGKEYDKWLLSETIYPLPIIKDE